jgi:biopolymer transport protein ExbD
MATLNISQNDKVVRGRTKKPLPSVDLTAMVDLAFLLITFFMLTTSLAKVNALNVVTPIDEPDSTDWQHYPATRTLTILLGKNSKAVCYLGEAKNASMQIVDLKRIKTSILAAKSFVAKTHQQQQDKVMLVIIKPTETSKYKNFVDIMDEMNINSIATYAIADQNLLDQERVFMKAKGI